jgi:hypothetical protein
MTFKMIVRHALSWQMKLIAQNPELWIVDILKVCYSGGRHGHPHSGKERWRPNQ